MSPLPSSAAGTAFVSPVSNSAERQPRLTVVESPIQRVDFLDQWRGLAVLVVFVYHALGISFRHYQPGWILGNWFRDFNLPKSYLALLPITWGWAGVSIFFVISGFCIHLSFRQKSDWAIFFSNRFFRIYPPYFVALVFFAFFFPITRLTLGSTGSAGQFASHVLLLHNLAGSFFDGINPSFWTIAVEAQLYLLFPVFLVLMNRIGWRRGLITVAAIEFTLRAAQGFVFAYTGKCPPQWLTSTPFAYWFGWGIGAALAEAHIKAQPVPFLGSSTLKWFALAAFCTFIGPLSFLSFPLFSVATASAIAKGLSGNGGAAMRLPSSFQQHLRWAGLWSYSIYLLHQPFLLAVPGLTHHLFTRVHPLGTFALCLAFWVPMVVFAGLYFRFCEKPSIRLGKTLPSLGQPVFEWRLRPVRSDFSSSA
ncbi:MAG: acyltransferase family protein [Chthoniobacterales bacterium]